MVERAWNSTPVIMMDFEGSPVSGVLEYGVVCLESGRIQATETGLCRPCGPIDLRDQAVHGIREADVADYQPFSSQYDRFVEYRRKGIFAAHNRHAENGFLKSTWPVPPRVPDWRKSGEGVAQEWGPWIDTLAIYKKLYPDVPSCALGNLVDTFQLREQLDELAVKHGPTGRRRAHCALYDALASALLLLRLQEEQALYGHLSLSWLLQFSRGHSPQRELF